ncbi:DNA polymerase III subunit delta' [Arachnia propionica]|uniref:DNA polymerase III subunit delta n=1 Tax=Arachnia propionica TaxID=1750 RepID=A0A3P1T7A9_9ACTN|nr:DNA polymerase III subunit delta' [Arachnia propionica]RRD05220.1 DNA polymerase III subunit delta' [Arachnia propionica]
MSVWDELVGQHRAVDTLRRAVEGGRHAMTHAWLFVGPPGSGRSNAARAFAAALQCRDGGCGVCNDCRTALSGAHPDVTLLRTEKLSIGVDEVRDLVSRANVSPVGGRWQVVVVEDADRVTERGADALLKSIEEPAPRTVWLLCAPSADDVIVTIRSRCRELRLVTPPVEEVARLLVERDKVDENLARHSAQAAQGHIGRARALALNEEVRSRRRAVLELPLRLTSLSGCLDAAARLVEDASAEATALTADLDAKEMAELQAALGMGVKGVRARGTQGAVKDLEEQQKIRVKRFQRDAIDGALTELTGWYRDVLAAQTAEEVPLVNADLADQILPFAAATRPEQTIRALDALLAAREALERNVAPVLALEAMLVELGRASRS